jgi:hypothetical protein
MKLILSIVLFFWLQAPAPRVIVGLVDGQQLIVDNPQFSGFIQTVGADAALKYRQENFHGALDIKSISRIDFDEYKRDQGFPLTITLRNGEKIQVQSEGPNHLIVKGGTDVGTVTINHPDPVSSPVQLRTSSPNRKDDLKITFLEFPTPR